MTKHEGYVIAQTAMQIVPTIDFGPDNIVVMSLKNKDEIAALLRCRTALLELCEGGEEK